LNLYASPAVRATLDRALGLSGILGHFCTIKWHEPTTEFVSLSASSGWNQNLLYRAIPLPARPPVFARKTKKNDQSLLTSTATTNLAYQFLNSQTKRQLLVAPDVGEITDELACAMEDSDAVLLDGTFWSSDELPQVRPGARTAQDMGHVTIRDGSLKLMAGLAARHKIYIHINNTNPVLSPDSPQRKAVEAAGIVVGYDGLEFEL
jgi:pyrroloquinoline quinone biosynthesis protein B